MTDTVWNFLLMLNKIEEVGSDIAVIILNQPILCNSDFIKAIWRNAAFRVLVDGGSNRWLSFIQQHPGENFQLPDFISGDFDSIKPNTRSYFESKKVKFILTPDQDETDFSKALKYTDEGLKLKNIKIKYVIVVCENAGRMDQIMANINTLYRSDEFMKDIRVIIFSSGTLTWVLRSGKHIIRLPDIYIKEQYTCGLIPLAGPTCITTCGLKWNLDNQVSNMGGLVSTSNTYLSVEVSVVCDKDLVWTTQYCQSVERI